MKNEATASVQEGKRKVAEALAKILGLEVPKLDENTARFRSESKK